MPDRSPYLTAAEIQDRFKISRSTIYRWGRNGTLTPLTVNGTVRYLRDEVEALFAPAGDAA